ncbi:hypothetical protein OSB04_025861 [Centaurea solstitialis]|uniref:Aminoalcoholphosphotransferase n=1 Tax=Centaurea solstitialis TaxID=347529 RepID=A0AA38WDH7_9ASTR|nr:hypothetical protein OSB04_025861 [Centaurea solstitialis]
MGYIGVHGINALHRYKYSGVDHSYLAKYVLQPFWSRFVNCFPLWMPESSIPFVPFQRITIFQDIVALISKHSFPITGSIELMLQLEAKHFLHLLVFLHIFYFQITLTGFMFLLISASLGYVYSPQLDSPPPRWVHFAHGLLLFLYQTFDAVDGKQARRTNSSSPLGELFDHGCDALACALEALAFGSTAMCGRYTFWFWVISAVPFYGATWEHYFTNTLILPAVNGPTEGLMLIYVAHFFTAIVGAEWWAQDFRKSIPLLSWVPVMDGIPTYGAVLFCMIVFAVIPTITFNIQNVYKVVRLRHGSMLKALAMLVPFGVLLGVVLLWDYMSPYNLIGKYPHMVVMGIGQAFGFLVGRMILAHLCDEPKGLKTSMSMSLFYLPLAIANALTAWLNDGVPLVDEKWVLLGFCLYTGALYLHFATAVIHEITTALGIYCFR